MKKLFMIFVCLSLTLTISSCTKTNYDVDGRDTHDYFGDGRFVILLEYGPEYNSKSTDETFKKSWCLYDQEADGKAIDEYVRTYKKIKPYVYVISSDGYTKVNYEDGGITKSKNITTFSDEDQKILKELEEKDEPIYK